MTSKNMRVVDSGDNAGREAEHTDSKVDPLKFEVADYLDTPEMLAGYLSEFVNEEDTRTLLEALRTACKAKGMVDVAMKAGLARESLYKALKPDSRPRMETFLAVIKALDLKLVVLPISSDTEDQSEVT